MKMPIFSTCDKKSYIIYTMPPDPFHFCHPLLTLLAERELHACHLQEQVRPSDIVQQTYLQAHANRDQFQGTTEAELRAWLIAILKNEVGQVQRKFFDTQKRDIRQVTALPENADDWLAGNFGERPSQQAAGNETEVILQESLKQLSMKEQEIIRLRVFEEKEFAEIATLLGKEESAVRKQLERTLKQWFTLYKKRMGE